MVRWIPKSSCKCMQITLRNTRHWSLFLARVSLHSHPVPIPSLWRERARERESDAQKHSVDTPVGGCCLPETYRIYQPSRYNVAFSTHSAWCRAVEKVEPGARAAQGREYQHVIAVSSLPRRPGRRLCDVIDSQYLRKGRSFPKARPQKALIFFPGKSPRNDFVDHRGHGWWSLRSERASICSEAYRSHKQPTPPRPFAHTCVSQVEGVLGWLVEAHILALPSSNAERTTKNEPPKPFSGLLVADPNSWD
ncbi:hypothetical protein F5Y15DRAFT_85089 [Xylariaceae sp. FL0016]|nr:hypothetical protein F5Y15DRAFT_85089 [Xylariaceae sp. FL0016]